MLHSKFTSPAVLRTLLVLVIASCEAADYDAEKYAADQQTWIKARNAIDAWLYLWKDFPGCPNGIRRHNPRMADKGPHGYRMCHLMGGGCKDYQRTGLGENPDTWTAYHCLEQDHSSYHGRNGGFNLEKAINHFGVEAVKARGRRFIYCKSPQTLEDALPKSSELISFGQLLKECATAYLAMKPTKPVKIRKVDLEAAGEAAAGARPPLRSHNAMLAHERARQRFREDIHLENQRQAIPTESGTPSCGSARRGSEEPFNGDSE